jgi:hypothetical protein
LIQHLHRIVQQTVSLCRGGACSLRGTHWILQYVVGYSSNLSGSTLATEPNSFFRFTWVFDKCTLTKFIVVKCIVTKCTVTN